MSAFEETTPLQYGARFGDCGFRESKWPLLSATRAQAIIPPQILVTYKSIGAPFLVDQTSAVERAPLPIHRRISLQRAETRRTSQAC